MTLNNDEIDAVNRSWLYRNLAFSDETLFQLIYSSSQETRRLAKRTTG